jgi:hypothetical protein
MCRKTSEDEKHKELLRCGSNLIANVPFFNGSCDTIISQRSAEEAGRHLTEFIPRLVLSHLGPSKCEANGKKRKRF